MKTQEQSWTRHFGHCTDIDYMEIKYTILPNGRVRCEIDDSVEILDEIGSKIAIAEREKKYNFDK